MTLQDDFLIQIQRASEQVGPVDGLDGAVMARRAVRRVRARRAALTGVGALAAVGVGVGAWAALAPSVPVGPASGGTPDGWTPVAVGGLALAVPPELEWVADGVWEVDGPAPGEGDENSVQVETVGEDAPLVPPGSDLTPVDVTVPGADSAAYVMQTFDDPTMVQDFTGSLQVHLESGAVVQVALSWVGAEQGRALFADLVRSVSTDEQSDPLPSPETTTAPEPLHGVAPGIPDGWRVDQYAGLTYAVPSGWSDDESPDLLPGSSRVASDDGASDLTVVQASEDDGWPASIAPTVRYPASTFPIDGADVVQVTSGSTDGRYTMMTQVRRENGRGYIVEVNVPDTTDGRRQALRLVGALGLTSGSKDRTGPGASGTWPAVRPTGWTEERREDLRLAVPAGWSSAETADGGIRWSTDPGATQPGQFVTVSTMSAQELSGAVPSSGTPHALPGAAGATTSEGELDAGDGRPRSFIGQVVLPNGDEFVVVQLITPLEPGSGSDPVPDPKLRFNLLVDSLELTGD